MGAFQIQPLQIRFNDIDLVGHVNNAVYPAYFDLARVSFFNAALAPHLDWDRIGFVLAHLSMDFLEPIYLDDQVEVLTRIIKTGTKSLEMEQIVRGTHDLRIHCTSRSVMVAFDYTDRQSVQLPQNWKERLDQLTSFPIQSEKQPAVAN